MREETGLDVEVGPVIEVFDRIMHDDEGRVQYHFVLVDYVCWPVGGTLAAAPTWRDVAWAEAAALADFHLTDKATAVIGQRDGPGRRGAVDPAAPPNDPCCVAT